MGVSLYFETVDLINYYIVHVFKVERGSVYYSVRTWLSFQQQNCTILRLHMYNVHED